MCGRRYAEPLARECAAGEIDQCTLDGGTADVNAYRERGCAQLKYRIVKSPPSNGQGPYNNA
jgi:hypothetical protein